jgi:hypothetical protein
MNDWEEFLGLVLCPSKAQSHWKPLFEHIRDSLLSSGHAEMRALYSDNPAQDRGICETIFQSLRFGVVEPNYSEFSRLPRFEIDKSVAIEFCRNFESIQSFVGDIIEEFNSWGSNSPFYVHLDAEWSLDSNRAPGTVAVIQLGRNKRIGVFLVSKLFRLISF